jgi:hypothetical protein
MKFEIERWKKRESKTGHVATFDVRLGDTVTVRGLGLIQPRHFPDVLWLHIPVLLVGGRQSVALRYALRDSIGERAVAMFNMSAGTEFRYGPPTTLTPDRVAADVEDSLQMAGLDA